MKAVTTCTTRMEVDSDLFLEFLESRGIKPNRNNYNLFLHHKGPATKGPRYSIVIRWEEKKEVYR